MVATAGPMVGTLRHEVAARDQPTATAHKTVIVGKMSIKIAVDFAETAGVAMKRFSPLSVTTLLCASVVFSGPAQAMEIIQFDKMAIQDQSDYITVVVEGAQKVLIDERKSDLAAEVHRLFTEIRRGDTIPIGMIAFEENLDRARVADLERHAKEPNAIRLEVEHAMIVTLKKFDITLSQSFMHVADNFKPKRPPRRN